MIWILHTLWVFALLAWLLTRRSTGGTPVMAHRRPRLWLVALLTAACWLPFEPHVMGIVRSSLGELSVSSFVFAFLLLAQLFFTELRARGMKLAKLCIFLVGLLLYANYLGFLPTGDFGFYDLGFSNVYLILSVGVFCLVLTYRGFWLIGGTITLALLAWSQGWLASRNVFDYLIDAPLWFISTISLICGWIKKSNKTHTQT